MKKSNLIFVTLLTIVIIIFLALNILKLLDLSIKNNIPHIWNTTLTNFFLAITFIGNFKTMAVMGFLLLLFLLLGRRKETIPSALLLVGTTLLVEILKLMVNKARPENSLIETTRASFPSSHAAASLVFFSLLIYLFKDNIKNKKLRRLFIVICIALIVLIGFSRIYLMVHYFSDVLAGFVVGLYCFYLFKTFHKS